MFKLRWALCSIFVALLTLSSTAWAVDGRVFNLTGSPTINGSPLRRSAPVNNGDTIKTPANSTVKIVMSDGTVLDIKANTEFKITDYVYEKRAKSFWSSKFSLIKGAFRYISGKIGKNAPDRVAVRAGTTTIGIRGSFQSFAFDGVIITIDSPIGTAVITFADGSSLAIGPGNSGTANVQSGETSFSAITTQDPVMQAAAAIANGGTVADALAGKSAGDQAMVLAVLINNGMMDTAALAQVVGAAAAANKENAAGFIFLIAFLDPDNIAVYVEKVKENVPADLWDDIDRAAGLGAGLGAAQDGTSAIDTAENPLTTSPTTD